MLTQFQSYLTFEGIYLWANFGVLPFWLMLIIIPAFASGEVYIPDHEYVGFYDHDGIYTVIGGVKNNEMYPVIPTITVNVNDDSNVFSYDYKFSSITSLLMSLSSILPSFILVPIFLTASTSSF